MANWLNTYQLATRQAGTRMATENAMISLIQTKFTRLAGTYILDSALMSRVVVAPCAEHRLSGTGRTKPATPAQDLFHCPEFP
jgi:hypothetical protein